MVEFHKIESAKLRSPIWVQMALIRSMLDQIKTRTGDQTLNRFIPEESRRLIKPHTVLQRTLDSMMVAYGTKSEDISDINALVSIESSLLLDCVREMKRRLNCPRHL